MTGDGKGPLQQAEASDNSQVTQVAGDYEEHHHRYVRGWEYLRGIRVDDAEMDLVETAFFDPPGPNGTGQVEAASDRLTRPYNRTQILVICAEAGAGRRTAALRMLRHAGVPMERILWLVLDWDQPRTEQIPHTEKHGFVLDLTGYRTLPEDFYTGLTDYQKDAESNSALLIILAEPSTWTPGTLTAAPVISLSRPPARQVATAHLRRLAPAREDWLDSAPPGHPAGSCRPGSRCRPPRPAHRPGQGERQSRRQGGVHRLARPLGELVREVLPGRGPVRTSSPPGRSPPGKGPGPSGTRGSRPALLRSRRPAPARRRAGRP
nr:hypothetical protein [Streptomyces sp. alain-838]